VSGNNSDTCHRVRALPNEPSSAKGRKWNAKEENKNRNKKEVERKQKEERKTKKEGRRKVTRNRKVNFSRFFLEEKFSELWTL